MDLIRTNFDLDLDPLESLYQRAKNNGFIFTSIAMFWLLDSNRDKTESKGKGHVSLEDFPPKEGHGRKQNAAKMVFR